jgi:hypothetical protein
LVELLRMFLLNRKLFEKKDFREIFYSSGENPDMVKYKLKRLKKHLNMVQLIWF